MTDYDANLVKRAAAGRWIEILAAAGCPAESLDGKHHPCPMCGGTDRFRLIDRDAGAVLCNQCLTDCGDGLAAVEWLLGWSFPAALEWVAGRLGVPSNARDMVAEVAAAKGVQAASLRLYGAQNADRDGTPVCRVPMWGPGGTQTGCFDIGRGSLGKGKTRKGDKLGIFLPQENPQQNPRKTPGRRTWTVCEGVKDAAALHELGFSAVGLPGSHPGKLAWQALLELLSGADVGIVPDADEASQGLVSRLIEVLGPAVAGLRLATLPGSEGRTDGYDVRDARRECGDEAVREAIEKGGQVLAPAYSNGQNGNGNGSGQFEGFAIRRPLVRLFESIEAKQVDWLWPRLIPNGALTLLCGKPGYGKSVVTCAIASLMTSGQPWPDHANSRPPGWAILVPFEDSAEHVIRPRLDAAGADLARVACFEMKGGRMNLGQAIDLAYLREAVKEFRSRHGDESPGIIIFDPISSAMGGRDGNADDDVRATLEMCQELAIDEQVAILGIRHLRKTGNKTAQQGDFIDRVKGAGAFVEVARQILGLGVHPELPENHLALAVAKSNFGAKRGYNVSFEIADQNGQPVAHWRGEGEIEIEDLAMGNARKRKSTAGADAGEAWLVELLKDAEQRTMGRREIEDMHEVAREVNGSLPSWRTVERSARQLSDDGLLDMFREQAAHGRSMWRLRG